MILPLAEKPAEKKVGQKAPELGRRIKFLFIDDEINILKMMEMFFEDSEVEIITAHTAEKGFKAFCDGDFDLILCDLGMDDMNGWEVGKKISTYCRTQGIAKPPFMLYTGLQTQLDPTKLEESGVERVVAKPIPFDDLLCIIREEVTAQRGCTG